ncbi:MAG: hypothetical protein HWQ35_23800 [Nostoc sp. NMS1]|uniref:hypothetical protein n=1 Tax=unclassified Nostoc TaxID=2593658 RepID=UPI0025F08FB1|nr:MULTISPECIES: hypothetical protein [unclassified Nostoc]MBN3909455.1 hypothetical protein [Nostoc sp. NMS1]
MTLTKSASLNPSVSGAVLAGGAGGQGRQGEIIEQVSRLFLVSIVSSSCPQQEPILFG